MESIKTYWVKNMVCRRCLKVIKQELEEIDVAVLSVELGKLTVRISTGIDNLIDSNITEVLHSNGFEIAKNEEEMIVENIKIALIELVGDLPFHIKEKTSEHLASELHRDYKLLSKIFSKNENTTIEKYLIKLKVERAKELIQLQQHTFSDIAYLLDYSSINHLSRQFKTITGLSMTDYKNGQMWDRSFLDEII
ncbi:AraC family transcriptional regulator [Arenibacter sp. N53]|jgi:AraC-like DNA-binding protein|uniref:Helix-turn-helix protein n=1 Tax=Arenibacter echinorum TaxID=440515 RepID=A0A327R2V3_9FLAO|nr:MULTISPECIES: AraC family transcriptional regulator [Arenibacter]MCK0191953.1 AraC family transcriptional regulator [Arenibacter sp. F20364]MCM4151979.1 AraC family transcriptional regulator [Arenibacter sp. N53]RAJ10292.1 helix-turn-helix protein [Arenibacter echinorum]GBF20590.1 transcriptional activator FtrA [Arenibacter sp. NBRC 103722]|tara:strand:- start:558 stop:1139 length:582 start_codon:yes stop_codon:yes gene_type:complete